MHDRSPRSLSFLFKKALSIKESPLHNIQQYALVLLKLNRTVKSLLPAPLHLWCRVANIQQGILVLEVANASWMMRLRYEHSMLLSTLQAEILPSLSSINMRINPRLMVSREHIAKNKLQYKPLRRYLSQESAKIIIELASYSPNKLRTILERLSELAK